MPGGSRQHLLVEINTKFNNHVFMCVYKFPANYDEKSAEYLEKHSWSCVSCFRGFWFFLNYSIFKHFWSNQITLVSPAKFCKGLCCYSHSPKLKQKLTVERQNNQFLVFIECCSITLTFYVPSYSKADLVHLSSDSFCARLWLYCSCLHQERRLKLVPGYFRNFPSCVA